MAGKSYKLVPEKPPKTGRVSAYEKMLREFLKSGEKSVRVEMDNARPQALYSGLLQARKRLKADLPTLEKVALSKKGDNVYIVRKATPRAPKK